MGESGRSKKKKHNIAQYFAIEKAKEAGTKIKRVECTYLGLRKWSICLNNDYLIK